MGRGLRQEESKLSGRRGASASECSLSVTDLLQSDQDPTLLGESISLNRGEFIVDADTPAMTAKGLADVKKVYKKPGDDAYLVTFQDGTQALVDLEKMNVAFSSGDDFPPHHLHGALSAALAVHGRDAQDATADLEHLADARNYYMDQQSPEALAIYAAAANHALGNVQNGDQLSINDPETYATLDNRRPRPDVLPRARRRERFQKARERLMRAIPAMGTQRAAMGLLYQVEEDTGEVAGPGDSELQNRLDAAKRLGGEQLIPPQEIDIDEETRESIGEYELGEQEETYFALLRNRLAVGQRGFALRGPPGSGKNAFVRQVAALRGAALCEFNIGPTYSFEDAIGSDGLAPVEAKEEQIVRDGQGNPVMGEDGKPLTETKVVGISSGSVQLEGPLARALQEDCVIVINEPEGMENEAVRLHSAVGDNVGDPGQRYLTVNSSAGEMTIPVHGECLVFFTYNSGEEDVRFKTALHDRMGNFDFEYPDVDEEAKRYAKLVTKAMNFQTEAPELQREFTAAEVEPIVRVMQRARDAHNRNPEDFVDVPGSRQGVHCYCDLLLQGYGGDDYPVDTMSTMLRYLLPGSDNMAVETRDAKIRDILTSDDHAQLEEIATASRESRDKGKKVKPKSASKANTKKKP